MDTTTLRPPRRQAVAQRCPQPSAAQRRANDLSVDNLQEAMAAAERYLARYPERAEGTHLVRCQCGALALSACPCPVMTQRQRCAAQTK